MKYSIKIENEVGEVMCRGEYDNKDVELSTAVNVLKESVMEDRWTMEIKTWWREYPQ